MQNWMDLDPTQESIELNNLIQNRKEMLGYMPGISFLL